MEPYEWQKPLIDTVVRGVTDHRIFISGFPTGSGKTVIALAAAKVLGHPHLVVAPKVALTHWARIARSMGAEGQLIGIINPDRISAPNGCEFYTRDGLWRLPKGTVVIWDEPHRGASGPKSRLTRALAELKAFAYGLHAMSATIADTPLKLRALGWWCGLHQFHDASFYQWCRQHECHYEAPGRSPVFAERRVLRFTKDAAKAHQCMEAIRRDLGPRFMSMRVEDIPGFPSESLGVKLLDLSQRDRAEIDAAYEAMSHRMASVARSDLAELNRERERVEFVMAAALAELVAAHVENGQSVVVFFSFTEPRQRFEDTLARDYGIVDLCRVYGGQKDEDRQSDIDAFQRNERRVASVMAKAGGASLSLHDERHERPRVAYVVPAYEADLIRQCLGRIRRCGGTHAVQFFALAAGTIQERVAVALERKLNNIQALNQQDLLPLMKG